MVVLLMHAFNLLVKDICDTDACSGILKKCKFITHLVRSRTAVIERFRALQLFHFQHKGLQYQRNLVFPCETRWYTQHACLHRVLYNQIVLCSLVTHAVVTRVKGHDKQAFCDMIGDDNLWASAMIAEQKLAPITEVIGTVESNSASLSEVYKCFVKLVNLWKDVDEECYELAFSRWQFIHTESMGFAYCLEPNACGGMNMYGNDKDLTMHQLKVYILNHKEVLSLDANLDAEAVVSEVSSLVDCVVNVTGVARENIINYPGKVLWNTIGREKFPILFKVASRLVCYSYIICS